MITYKDYENIISTVYNYDQEHVFEYWDELNDKEKRNLLDELSSIDFDLMGKLYNQKFKASGSDLEYNPSPYIPLPESEKEKERFKYAEETGKEYIATGKMAALLVAGGQGTRLGFDGPKGMFPIGPVSNKSLFQIHAEKILKSSKKYNVSIPWLIMTSKSNRKETIEYFNNNNNFGLDKKDILFFSQDMIPSLDIQGKLILKTKSSIFMNPDGHGGTLTALITSRLLVELKKRGIESISYFQVDNPLVRIIDPVFIGFHILNGSNVSSKAVMKTDPKEKVGLFVKYDNGKTGVIEYSDMPHEKKSAVDINGKLLFRMGNIAVHLFKREYIEDITSGKDISLPYHLARKNIKTFKGSTEIEVNGLKFEKFIFDALALTEKNTILETVRKEEFAPVKNSEGIDSPRTAKALMIDLHRKWLLDKGINLSGSVKVIEISPLLAVGADDLPKDISVPSQERVYLE